jgi:hypothetical protein
MRVACSCTLQSPGSVTIAQGAPLSARRPRPFPRPPSTQDERRKAVWQRNRVPLESYRSAASVFECEASAVCLSAWCEQPAFGIKFIQKNPRRFNVSYQARASGIRADAQPSQDARKARSTGFIGCPGLLLTGVLPRSPDRWWEAGRRNSCKHRPSRCLPRPGTGRPPWGRLPRNRGGSTRLSG